MIVGSGSCDTLCDRARYGDESDYRSCSTTRESCHTLLCIVLYNRWILPLGPVGADEVVFCPCWAAKACPRMQESGSGKLHDRCTRGGKWLVENLIGKGGKGQTVKGRDCLIYDKVLVSRYSKEPSRTPRDSSCLMDLLDTEYENVFAPASRRIGVREQKTLRRLRRGERAKKHSELKIILEAKRIRLWVRIYWTILLTRIREARESFKLSRRRQSSRSSQDTSTWLDWWLMCPFLWSWSYTIM